MRRIRFVMLGGFLGAGKTTAISRLARHYVARGNRVGLVTNDQAQDLVDTHSLRAQGLPVEEVSGACFCCKFDDLIARAERLDDTQQPDVILAEPVGSCTDLVATVVQPLKDLYRERFQIAPYAVLFKPSHGLRILRNESDGGFSPKAAYIFKKQLEEADAIVVNRIDELSSAALGQLEALVKEAYPGVPVLRISALTGAGFDALPEFLAQEGNFGKKILDIDYDIYAEGEAELGWLNNSVHLTGRQPFNLDAVLVDIVTRLGKRLCEERAEIAHLKTIGLAEASFGTANLVSNQSTTELSLPSKCKVTEADVIVNARVALDPAELEAEVRKAVLATCSALGCRADFRKVQSFRPARPQPTHRYAAAK
jgi:Ni2+-binding GTPase involved in maturation of urease and hydrogenase